MIVGCDKGRAHGNLGFAETHIAAHKTVHDFFGTHVGSNGFNSSRLVRCFFKIKAIAEFCPSTLSERVRVTNSRFTFRVNLQQLSSNIGSSLRRLLTGFAPLLGTQSVQGCRVLITTGIATDEVKGANRYVEFVIIRIFEQQKLRVMTVNGQDLESHVPADTVLKMDNG